MLITLRFITKTCAPLPTMSTAMAIPPARLRTIDIAAVSLTGFWKSVKMEKCLHKYAMTFTISAADINAMQENQEKDMIPDIPEEYQEFMILFS